MKIVGYNSHGPASVLKSMRAKIPTLKRDYMLVKIQAIALNPKDCKIRSAKSMPKFLSGLSYPKQTGSDWCGVIVDIHDKDKANCAFTKGDCVFGYLDGFSAGCSAEYKLVKHRDCWKKPESFSPAQAAALGCSYLTSLQVLRDFAKLSLHSTAKDTPTCGRLFGSGAASTSTKCPPRVLVYGASGGCGTSALQLGKHFFGAHMTALSHSRNEQYCLDNGADSFIAYDQTDIFSKAFQRSLPESDKFDVFYQIHMGPNDGSNNQCVFPKVQRLMNPKSTFVALMPESNPLRYIPWAVQCRPQYKFWLSVANTQEDLRLLSDLAGAGSWLHPHVQEIEGLEGIEQGHELLEAGSRTNGKLVVVLPERE
jgi:NADPH:quinone reductase-like Zn-dependent oxidoreductase